MGRKKKEIKLKEPVRIREKNLLDGSISLYLDIYYRGNRKKEGLKLYLVPEINATTKLQNANTRKLAEQIKAQRILDIQKEGLVDWEKVKKSKADTQRMVRAICGRQCRTLRIIQTFQKKRTGTSGTIPIPHREA